MTARDKFLAMILVLASAALVARVSVCGALILVLVPAMLLYWMWREADRP